MQHLILLMLNRRFSSFDISHQIREGQIEIVERFLIFVDCSEKTGSAVASLILKTLKENEIPLTDCRGQGYYNGANMVGKYKGLPCGCHTLNLCGTDSAECCLEAITLFGTIQSIYTIFSSSPKR